MTGRCNATRTRPYPGFTLVEVLVVIALLGLLATLAVPLFHADTPQQVMQRSCERLISLMAMCRAQAMLNGHPVRLGWEAPEENPEGPVLPTVTHEADPVETPGEFKLMAASWASEPVVHKDVRIRLVQPGTFDLVSLTKTQGQFDLPAEPRLATVEFHPDGTADPAVFVLTTRLPEGSSQEELQGWVVLDGISGLARPRTPPTPKQFEGMLDELAALPDLQFEEKAVEVTETSPTNPAAALFANSGMTQEDLDAFIASLNAGAAAATGAAAGGTGAGGASSAAPAGSASANASGGSGSAAPAAAPAQPDDNRSRAGRNNRSGSSNAGGRDSNSGRNVSRAGGNDSDASNGDDTDGNRPGGRRGSGRGSGGRSSGSGRGGTSR